MARYSVARLLLGGPLVRKGTALLFEVVFDRRPDVVEFLLDQARRRLEFVVLVELIEHRPLELLARSRGVLALDALAQRVPQLAQRIQSEALGEVIVQSDLTWRLDRLRGDRERRVFARKGRRRIVLGKLDVEGSAVAGL